MSSTMFQQQRAQRSEGRGYLGNMKCGRLTPVMAVPVEPSEFGVLNQTIRVELDPVIGRLVTPIFARLTAVFVPTQAIHALKNAPANTAGLTEIMRQELLTLAPMFVLEADGEIAKRCEVIPVMIGGVAKTSERTRLSHAAAVNALRQRLYDKASLVDKTLATITPALLSSTALQRMRGVLDPDDHINGKVPLTLASMNIPVDGIYTYGSTVVEAAGTAVRGTQASFDGTTTVAGGALVTEASADTGAAGMRVKVTGNTTTSRPDVWARFTGGAASMSLEQLYSAQKMDELTGIFRQILEDDPINGEKQILRLCYGFNLDEDRNPVVLAQREVQIAGDIVAATDTAGVSNETRRTDLGGELGFSVVVPKTEMGGMVITFLEVKPDEVMTSQPHPILSEPFVARNYAAAEMDLLPVPVLMRQLDSAVSLGNETVVAMYTGAEEIKRRYNHYGLSRNVNPTTLGNKSVMWNFPIPLSVTPENILYPAVFDAPIFAFPTSEIVTYFIESVPSFATPIIFGPSPVETIAALTTNDLFDEVP